VAGEEGERRRLLRQEERGGVAALREVHHGCGRQASMAIDMTTIATVVAPVSGSDHCQPMVSCDHVAAPKPRKIVTQQTSGPVMPCPR